MNRVFYSLRKTSYSTVKVRNNKPKTVIKRKMHSSSNNPDQDPEPFPLAIIASAVATYLLLKTHNSQKK